MPSGKKKKRHKMSKQKVIFSLKDKIKNKLVKVIVSRVCSLFKY